MFLRCLVEPVLVRAVLQCLDMEFAKIHLAVNSRTEMDILIFDEDSIWYLGRHWLTFVHY